MNLKLNINIFQGYQTKDAYIVTQCPLVDTINDIWKMVYQFRCPIIVCLETDKQEEVCNSLSLTNLGVECLALINFTHPKDDAVLNRGPTVTS